MTNRSVSIVIVNWNTGHLLADCVSSIILHKPALACEVIVVDNASTDGSLAKLSNVNVGDVPLSIFRNENNLGFAAANNQGIAASTGEFIMLLNPDTLVREGAINALVSALESHPQAGAAGPKLCTPEGDLQVSVLRSPPALLEILMDGFHLFRLIPQPYRGEWLLGRHWKHDRLRSVPSVFGTAMLVRRASIDESGSLDERFGMYAEDEEWCVRLRRRGWEILFVPNANIMHFGRRSAKVRWDRSALNSRIVASRLRCFYVCLSRPQFFALLVATLVAYSPNLFVSRWIGINERGSYLETACALYFRELKAFCLTGKWKSAF